MRKLGGKEGRSVVHRLVALLLYLVTLVNHRRYRLIGLCDLLTVSLLFTFCLHHVYSDA